MSLSNKQLAVELCSIINNWARLRIYDFKAKTPGTQQIVETYYLIGPSLFFNLARIAINV
jgi:hypothetical protein